MNKHASWTVSMSVRLSSWIIVRCIVQFLLLEECLPRDLQITTYCSCAIPYKCVLQSRSQVHVTLVQRNGRPLGIGIEFAARHSSGTLSKQRRQRQQERHQTKGLMSRTNKFPRAKTKSSKSTPLYQEIKGPRKPTFIRSIYKPPLNSW